MAGKADLVNGIVGRDASYIKKLPVHDGWGTPAAEDAAQEAELPGTGRWIDPFGGLTG